MFNNVAIAATHAQQKHGLHRCVLGRLQVGPPHPDLPTLGWAPGLEWRPCPW